MRSFCMIVIVIFSVLSLVGCASITGSKLQPVSVNAIYKGDEIDGAKCSLMNDKGSWYTTTPGSVTIQKSYSDMVVTCKKSGIATGTASVVSSATAGVWGNVLAGGVIGYAVDASSGSGFDYPTNINVEMGKTINIAPPKQQPTKQQNTFQQ